MGHQVSSRTGRNASRLTFLNRATTFPQQQPSLSPLGSAATPSWAHLASL
jgi:hypothetical protein